jgi:hypothetical protein
MNLKKIETKKANFYKNMAELIAKLCKKVMEDRKNANSTKS